MEDTKENAASAQAESKGQLDHLQYVQKLSQKPFKTVENDYLKAQHGRAIVGRDDSVGLFLINRIASEQIRCKDREPYTAHRVFVTSTGGGKYAKIGWIVQEEVRDCMCCQASLVTDKKLQCVNCGDVICSTCGSQEAVIASLESLNKFRVCSACFVSLNSRQSAPSTPNARPNPHRVSTVSRLDSGDQQATEKFATALANVTNNAPAADTAQHVSFIRSLARRTIYEVKRAYQQAQQGRAMIQRKSSFIISRNHSAIVEAYIISKLTTEETVLDRKSLTAYRVYVTSTGGGDYCKVGWVLMDNIPACMICQTAFGLLTAGKHHCLACGDVICAKCSPNKAIIEELRSEEMHRICSTCQTNNGIEVGDIRPVSVQISPTKRPSVTPDKVGAMESSPPAAPVVVENVIRMSKRIAKPIIIEVSDDIPSPPPTTKAVAPEVLPSEPDNNRKSVRETNVEIEAANQVSASNTQAAAVGGTEEEEGEEHPIIRDLAESLDQLLQLENSSSEPIVLASITDDEEDEGGDTFDTNQTGGEENIAWLQDVLSSDGETAVIPVRRLSHDDQSSFMNKGYIEEGSEYAFVPTWKVQLRRVQPAQKKEIFRAPSAKDLVHLRPVDRKEG